MGSLNGPGIREPYELRDGSWGGMAPPEMGMGSGTSGMGQMGDGMTGGRNPLATE
jgi:hypothetical protein